MKVELSRFRVKDGKSERVDEWMKMLNDRMPEVIQTLEREKMHVEVIFRDQTDDGDYLYWFSIQDDDGESVLTSPFELDHSHMAFSEECLEPSSKHDADPQVVMLPSKVADVIGWQP